MHFEQAGHHWSCCSWVFTIPQFSFFLFSNARSCEIWTRPCWFVLENDAPAWCL